MPLLCAQGSVRPREFTHVTELRLTGILGTVDLFEAPVLFLFFMFVTSAIPLPGDLCSSANESLALFVV